MHSFHISSATKAHIEHNRNTGELAKCRGGGILYSIYLMAAMDHMTSKGLSKTLAPRSLPNTIHIPLVACV